jgi:hypothetical protein
MTADKLGHPPPIVQSMILADHIHRDSITGKKFILGTYNSIVATRFPFAKPGMCVYVAITDAHGQTVLRLRIVDVDDGQAPIHESAYPVDMPDPNEVYEITFGASMVFPVPGHYRVQLLADNELLRELRLHVGYPKPMGPQAHEP